MGINRKVDNEKTERLVLGYPHSVDGDEEYAQRAPLPEYSDDGVDLTLIRWTLSLTPAERLEFLNDRIDDILRIRALNGTE